MGAVRCIRLYQYSRRSRFTVLSEWRGAYVRYVLFRRESINCSYLLGRSNKRLFLSCCHSTEKSTQSGGGAGVILCVTIRLDANPVAGLGSLRKRRRRSAAVPYFFLWFAGRRQWICLVVFLLTADNIQKLVLRMHLFVTDMCAHSHNIFFVSSSDSTPLLLIYFFLLNLFIFTIHCSFILFFFVSYFLFIFTRNSLSFVLFIYTVSIIQLILLVIMLLWWWWLFLLFFFFRGKEETKKKWIWKVRKSRNLSYFALSDTFIFLTRSPVRRR